MSQATNIDVPLKTLVTKPKAKGRFGSSQATRSHQPRDLVFDRVEDTLTGTGQSSKPESRNIAPARGMKQKYAQSRPYYKDNRRLKTDSTEGNWRHREDKSVNTSGQADTTLLSGCNRKGGGKSQVEKGYNEYLIENLVKGSYECAICYGVVNQETAVWSCGKCHHLFHFYCIKRWANTLMNQGEDREKWRCPTCQEAYATVPNQYRCYCGKIRDPVWNNHDTPHSCGEVCGRKRADNCSHKCNELCHPGPCPPCSAYTFKHCNCGRSCQNVRCSQQVNVRCSLTCEKKLNCGKHTCLTVCHAGSCQPCDEVIQQVCHCGTSQRQITCGSEGPYSEVYSCGKDCDRLLSCGKHNCTQPCHSGSCLPCKTSPEVVLNCNCGKVPLAALKDCEPRTSCTDSIPSCENICGKELNCGSQFKEASSASTFKRHLCQLMCHEGACLCRLTSKITCQCGNKKSTMPCEEAMKYSAGNPYKCEKKCSKKRECGRHKCGQLCCTLANHPCMQICGKRLSCGTHKCTELCHLGKCPMCYNVSFDELHCHCGVTIMYPPIPCGTRPPECPEMCNRLHACEHPVLHRCHAEESCPPCATLTTKLCMGEHELRNNVPCWIKELSCGRTCARPLPCGDHKCPKTCHKGECGEQVCHQPCPREREACKHRCGAECHKGWECPSTDCHQRVTLQCACGNRKQEVLCYMKNKRLHTSTLASRLKELGSGLTISELTSSLAKNQLECDEECAQLERNQRIASALDICNPNLLASLAGMQYSDFLKDMARKDPVFISDVETSLSQLVLSSQQSKQLTRSHPFKPMKKKQRTAVHELAEHYSCTTLSYDEEPLRNVVATAHRGKSKLPTQSLTSFVKCEKQPPPPVPIPANANFQELQNKSKKDLQSTDIKSEDNEITDYFDMT
ncbi:transcriptional repressor NF-X1-like isoform X2 [Watersipora subatra]|uniref:transcriptional repressor NF-X1-like isoform X2 n=1 Tax=Watersipora subatra TaxID=2589382 RepID=UPI00355C0E58